MSERLTHTVTEAAQKIGINRNAAYDLVKSGDLPSIRIGRRIVIPRLALERWLEERASDRAPAA